MFFSLRGCAVFIFCCGGRVSSTSTDAHWQSVRDIRVRYPTYDEPLALFEVFSSMTAVEKAAVLLEESYIQQVGLPSPLDPPLPPKNSDNFSRRF
jgi:hypothetical protein